MSSRNRVGVGMYAFYCDEPRHLAAFWAELMDLPVADGATDDFVILDFHHEVGPVTWLFHRADAGAPPPANPIRLDIGIDDEEDWATVAERAETAGATRVAQHEQYGARWIEMLGPEGNAFRAFAPRPV